MKNMHVLLLALATPTLALAFDNTVATQYVACIKGAFQQNYRQCTDFIKGEMGSENADNDEYFITDVFCQSDDGTRIYDGRCYLSKKDARGPQPQFFNITNPGQDSPNRPVCKKGSVLNLNTRSAGESISLSGLPFQLSYQSSSDSSRVANRIAELHVSYNSIYSNNENLQLFPFKQLVISVNSHEQKVINLDQSIKIDYRDPIDESLFSETAFFKSADVQYDIQSMFEIPDIGRNAGGSETQTTPLNVTSTLYNKKIRIYKPEVWGLGGWTLTNHHFYDVENKIIHWGTGGTTEISLQIKNFPDLGAVYMGTDEIGSEVYLFDLLGRHLQTRTSLMGVPIYQFRYLSDHKLDQIINRDGLVTKILRDSSSRPTGIQSPFGVITSFNINSFGKLSTVENATGARHQITYYNSGGGLIENIAYPSELQTHFDYDADGFFTKETKSTGAIQELVVTLTAEFQKMEFFKNSGVADTSISTSSDGIEKTSVTDAGGALISTSLFSASNEIEDIGIMNITTKSTDDIRFGSLARMPTSIVTGIPGLPNNYISQDERFTYSVTYKEGNGPFQIQELTKNTEMIAVAGPTIRTSEVFNGMNNTLESSTSINNKQKIYFDNKERVTRIEGTGSIGTNLSFNSYGQLQSISQGASSTTFGYDSRGYLNQTADSLGHTTQYERNANGQVTKKIWPNGDSMTLAYTPSGQVKEIHTPNGQVHQFAVSTLDQVISYIAPSLGFKSTEIQYTYDSFGRIMTITKPSGQKAQFHYKPQTDFVERIETPDGDYVFNSLDVIGRPSEVISPDGIRTVLTWVGNDLSTLMQYDGNLMIGEVNRQFTSMFKVSYLFGGSSTPITYEYDTDNHMIRAGDETYAYQINNTNNPETASVTITSTSGNLNGYQRVISNYQTAGEMEDGILFTAKTSTQLSSVNNPYKPFNLKIESLSGKKQQILRTRYQANSAPATENRYQYDENDRLVGVSGQISAQYDFPSHSNNNIRQYTHGGKITTAEYDNQDRLISLKGAIERNIAYSDDGEMTKISNCLGEKKYEYNFFGYLKKVTLPDGKVIEYKLDAFNRRVAKLINGQVQHYYLWQDQNHLWAVLNPDGTIDIQYVYGPYPQAPIYFFKEGSRHVVLPNERGDIKYTVQYNGDKLQVIDYDEYGTVLNDTSVDANHPEGLQPLGFASGLTDADTKLTVFNARNYDPVVGRWTSKDPAGFDGGDTNLYSYVAQDPVNKIDPTGLYECTYSISAHSMSCTSSSGNPAFSSTNFVSGNGASQNNPNATNVSNSGPIPIGGFNVGGQHPNSSRRDLAPQLGTELFGRTSFQTHGCANPATCSDGCIAATTNATRDELNRIFGLEEGHNTIRVVP